MDIAIIALIALGSLVALTLITDAAVTIARLKYTGREHKAPKPKD